MTEEIFEINKDILCRLSELNKDKVYVFNIEVGDMPKEQIYNYLTNFKDVVSKTGIKGIYLPTSYGIGKVDIKELASIIEESK